MIVKAMGLGEISQVEKVVREAVGELGPSEANWQKGNQLGRCGTEGRGWEFELDFILWKYSSFLFQINIPAYI